MPEVPPSYPGEQKGGKEEELQNREKGTMKLQMVSITVFFVAVAAYPQASPGDWSWTFLRNGETCGLSFEDTNLPVSVKAAIRDDVCWSYSLAADSNRFTRLYAPGDPEYGTFVGREGVEGDYGCAVELSEWNYNLHNGSRYFHVAKNLSARFLQAIALTNQHPVAAGSLSNFLHTANHLSVTNTTPAAFAQMWWRFKEGRAGALADDTPQSFTEGIQSMSEDSHYHSSVLLFWARESTYWRAPSDGQSIFGCTIKSIPKTGGDGFDQMDMDTVYKDGQWRFVAWE